MPLPNHLHVAWSVKALAAERDRRDATWIVISHRVAAVAEDDGHHPDLHVESYRKVSVELWTHAIGGLSENDFIYIPMTTFDKLYPDVERVYLAGGFGLNLGIDSAISCGLLAGFRRDQIEVVGNSSLGGAYVCLLDRQRAADLERATKGARIIELNEDPDFEDTYIDHLNLEPLDL